MNAKVYLYVLHEYCFRVCTKYAHIHICLIVIVLLIAFRGFGYHFVPLTVDDILLQLD